VVSVCEILFSLNYFVYFLFWITFIEAPYFSFGVFLLIGKKGIEIDAYLHSLLLPWLLTKAFLGNPGYTLPVLRKVVICNVFET